MTQLHGMPLALKLTAHGGTQDPYQMKNRHRPRQWFSLHLFANHDT